MAVSNPQGQAVPKAVLLFDIDGVIRDVGASYRRAIIETVHHFSGIRPLPADIDALKAEGCWNNDWHASMELLRRQAGHHSADAPRSTVKTPTLETLVEVFNGFYFGGDPDGDPSEWQGFIGDEPLLVSSDFFTDLQEAGVAWGFVSGAEPASARFVLERRLGLHAPPLIAMGDAPDKPDPTGFLELAHQLLKQPMSATAPPVAYLGDTVADVHTVVNARRIWPQQAFFSLAVAPPHLQAVSQRAARAGYEEGLSQAGADVILSQTCEAAAWISNLSARA